MKISSKIYPYRAGNNYTSTLVKSNCQTINNSISNTKPSFEGFLGKDLLIKSLRLNPIRHFENFSLEEYRKLTTLEINRLRYKYKTLLNDNFYFYNSIADIHDYAATCMQTVFDNRFGKGNYIVLPIGRSLSSICKSLSYKIGEENVINLPLGNARRFYNRTQNALSYETLYQQISTAKGLETFQEYLKSVNLTKEYLENSKKNLILTDYCYTGESLKGAEALIKSNLILGNKKNNIFAVDFLNLLKATKIEKNEIPESILEFIEKTNCRTLQKLIGLTLNASKYKNFSFVGHSPTLADTMRAATANRLKKAQPETRLVWFKLLDKEMSPNKKVLQVELITPHTQTNYSKQKIEPWHNSKSQYESDLRNDIQKICEIMINFDGNLSKHSQSQEQKQKYLLKKTELYNLYNHITDYYNEQSNAIFMTNYYASRTQIHDFLENIEKFLL